MLVSLLRGPRALQRAGFGAAEELAVQLAGSCPSTDTCLPPQQERNDCHCTHNSAWIRGDGQHEEIQGIQN